MDKFLKILVVSVIIFAIVSLAYISMRDTVGIFTVVNFRPFLITVGFIIILAGLVILISTFLDSSKYNDNRALEWKYLELLKKYKISIDGSNNDEALEEATNLLRDKLENISAENYFQEFKQKVKTEIVVEILENKTKNIESRVQGEIGRLSKSGIINLSLGMMLSIGGILYLGNFVVNVQIFKTMQEMFINTFPKTIFVLLIEVFAYFFLRLYKQNLDDIKYYQNELTNIESKNLALQIAKQSNNHKLISLCIEEFLSTERNFILEKDQSTIEIEKERISSNNTNNTLQILKDILKK
ncbi:hypothetical protein [Acinetobacter baumannii]|uniref:hypothetical protein n=1 Tax=Acinetobacter baumannii TaxID=470 RepID=UPI00286FD52A|nr:hypothetical protein [Acinetobacter baumannii]MDR9561583.1 hypothetical protein [Acinetobacter baumannii]